MSVTNAEIEGFLRDYVTETVALRFEGTLPPAGAGPDEIIDGLIATRQRLDRVEELMVQTLRIRAAAKRGSTAATATMDDQWDQAVRAIGTSSVVRGTEFQGPRERYAEANLDTFEARREARRAAQLHSMADEAYEAIRAMHWGLNGLRQDHETMLRAMQLTTRLES